MKGDNFRANEIVSRGKHGGQGEGVLALVSNKGVDSPGTTIIS